MFKVSLSRVAALALVAGLGFAGTEKVRADLGVAERFHVGVGAVDAASGFVEADDGDGVQGVGGAGGEFAKKVGVETF